MYNNSSPKERESGRFGTGTTISASEADFTGSDKEVSKYGDLGPQIESS
jgi:hypothetical protein